MSSHGPPVGPHGVPVGPHDPPPPIGPHGVFIGSSVHRSCADSNLKLPCSTQSLTDAAFERSGVESRFHTIGRMLSCGSKIRGYTIGRMGPWGPHEVPWGPHGVPMKSPWRPHGVSKSL